jgi:hypothetical protein
MRHNRGELLPKPLLGKHLRAASDNIPIESRFAPLEFSDDIAQRLWRLFVEEYSSFGVLHSFKYSAPTVSNDRAAARHRFHWNKAEILLPGKDKRAASAVELNKLFLGDLTYELNIRRCVFL